ncbi:hypothetical protein EV2_038753 [Malus domestica]
MKNKDCKKEQNGGEVELPHLNLSLLRQTSFPSPTKPNLSHADLVIPSSNISISLSSHPLYLTNLKLSPTIPCDKLEVVFQAVKLYIADRVVLQVENSLDMDAEVYNLTNLKEWLGLHRAVLEGGKEDGEAAGNDARVAEGLDINDLVEDEDEEESRWDLGLGLGKTGKDKEKR